MLDINLIREKPELIEADLKKRHQEDKIPLLADVRKNDVLLDDQGEEPAGSSRDGSGERVGIRRAPLQALDVEGDDPIREQLEHEASCEEAFGPRQDVVSDPDWPATHDRGIGTAEPSDG